MPKLGAYFAAYGERKMRWIEKPEDYGLRFVGLASELAELHHTGWYTNEFQDETAKGVVYALPGHKGKARLIPGVADPNQSNKNGRGPALLSFDTIYECIPGDKQDTTRIADRLAERYAEEERDYSDAWQAGSQWAELGAEIAETRKLILTLCREFKAARASAQAEYPTLCAAIRKRITRLVESIHEAREKRGELWESAHGVWYTNHAPHLLAAFDEGAAI